MAHELQSFLEKATLEKLQEFKHLVHEQSHARYLDLFNAIQTFKYTKNDQERSKQGGEIWKTCMGSSSNFAQHISVETRRAITNEPLPPSPKVFDDVEGALFCVLYQDYEIFRAPYTLEGRNISSSSSSSTQKEKDDVHSITHEPVIRKAPSKGERKGSDTHLRTGSLTNTPLHVNFRSEGGFPYARILPICLTLQNHHEKFYTGAEVCVGAFARAIIKGNYCVHTPFDPSARYGLYVESCMEDRRYNNQWLEDNQPLKAYENILCSMHTIVRPRIRRKTENRKDRKR